PPRQNREPSSCVGHSDRLRSHSSGRFRSRLQNPLGFSIANLVRISMIVRARVRLSASTLLCCLMAVAGDRAQAAPPVVAGFERFGKTDAAAGQLLLGELNCVACHQPAEAAALVKQAPVLDNVGTRIRAGYFKKYLADPQQVK